MNSTDLSSLPRKNNGLSNKIDWKNSVGQQVNFSYQNINDSFKITSYYSRGKSYYTTVLYLGQEVELHLGNVTKAKLGKLKEIYDRLHNNHTKRWTNEEVELIRKHFPHMQTAELQSMLPNRTVESIQTMAQRLGVRKDKEHVLKIKRQNSLTKVKTDRGKELNLCHFFCKYKKSLDGVKINTYGKYSSMKKEWVILLFKYYLKRNSISQNRDFWIETIIGDFLQTAKLKTAVKACFESYYDFLTQCFPKYGFKEWEFKYLDVRDGFWDKEYNRFHCIREGIIKMKSAGVISQDAECLELSHTILSHYTSSSLITYEGKDCIVEYLVRKNIELENRIYWNNIRFDSYEEKRLFLHIKNNFHCEVQKGNRKEHLYCNLENNENYIPDLIITSANGNVLDKPIVIEYFGMFKEQTEHEVYSNYREKTMRKIEYFKSLEGIWFVPIFPHDLKEDYKGVNKKLTPFLL